MTPAHKVLPAVIAELLHKAPLCPEKVTFAWRVAVGPALARATSVRLDADGVLHVAAHEAQWGVEVRRSSKLILTRLETLLGPGVAKRIRCPG